METIRHNSNEKVFLFSDAHLGGHDDSTETVKVEALGRFFRHLTDTGASALYVVGDFWDFGFEYKHCLPKELLWGLAELGRLTNEGVEVHFIGGNHDFWINDFLVRRIGIICHSNPVELNLDGQRYFLAHGDGISSDDAGYRLLKRILRSRILVRLYGIIHPDIGIPFAKWIAGLGKADKEADPCFPDLESVARKKIVDEGYQGAIFGHRHFPQTEQLETGRIIVLGDWIRWFTYLCFHDGELSLERWPAEGKNRPAL
jgi:UDP-2,3-diacylglucosamine hydrolase